MTLLLNVLLLSVYHHINYRFKTEDFIFLPTLFAGSFVSLPDKLLDYIRSQISMRVGAWLINENEKRASCGPTEYPMEY